MGKAVIASKADGTKEVIQHNGNGIMVSVENLEEEVANAINLIASDTALRTRLGDQARATITNTYSAAKMTRAVEEIYLELLNRVKSKEQGVVK